MTGSTPQIVPDKEPNLFYFDEVFRLFLVFFIILFSSNRERASTQPNPNPNPITLTPTPPQAKAPSDPSAGSPRVLEKLTKKRADRLKHRNIFGTTSSGSSCRVMTSQRNATCHIPGISYVSQTCLTMIPTRTPNGPETARKTWLRRFRCFFGIVSNWRPRRDLPNGGPPFSR